MSTLLPPTKGKNQKSVQIWKAQIDNHELTIKSILLTNSPTMTNLKNYRFEYISLGLSSYQLKFLGWIEPT